MASGTPHIRTSERGTFKRCRWRWWQAYREGLKPKRTKPALLFGEWVHVSLARWYCGPGAKRGPHPAETFSKTATALEHFFKTEEATEEEVAKYEDLYDLGIVLLDEYIKEYGRDEHWHIISPEQTFRFGISWPEVTDRLWVPHDRFDRKLLALYIGTFDLVYLDLVNELIWLGEHKTAKSVSVDHLVLDEQAGSYVSIAARSLIKQGLMKPGQRIHGINYNFLRKGLPDPRPRDEAGYCLNKDGSRSKVQPKPLFLRHPVPRTSVARRNQLLRIQDDAISMEAVRIGHEPVTKTPHTSCARFCEFFDICRLHEEGGNWEDLRDVQFTVEDPYADHRRKSTDDSPTFEFG